MQDPAVDHREPLLSELIVGTSVEDQAYAEKILKEIDPTYRTRCGWPVNPMEPATRAFLCPGLMPLQAEWTRAHEESKKRASVTAVMLERYHFACALMQSYLVRGRIRSFHRWLHGDGFTEIPATHWIGEGLQFRFDLARFDASKPFDPQAAQFGSSWIFADRAGVDLCGHEFMAHVNAQMKAQAAVSSTKQQVDACFRWLLDEMRKSPGHKPAPKDDFKSKAKSQFGVGDRKFDECWSAAVSETGATVWSRSGAPVGPRKSTLKSTHD